MLKYRIKRLGLVFNCLELGISDVSLNSSFWKNTILGEQKWNIPRSPYAPAPLALVAHVFMSIWIGLVVSRCSPRYKVPGEPFISWLV